MIDLHIRTYKGGRLEVDTSVFKVDGQFCSLFADSLAEAVVGGYDHITSCCEKTTGFMLPAFLIVGQGAYTKSSSSKKFLVNMAPAFVYINAERVGREWPFLMNGRSARTGNANEAVLYTIYKSLIYYSILYYGDGTKYGFTADQADPEMRNIDRGFLIGNNKIGTAQGFENFYKSYVNYK